MIQKDLDFHFRPGKPVNAALKKIGLEMLQPPQKDSPFLFLGKYFA